MHMQIWNLEGPLLDRRPKISKVTLPLFILDSTFGKLHVSPMSSKAFKFHKITLKLIT